MWRVSDTLIISVLSTPGCAFTSFCLSGVTGSAFLQNAKRMDGHTILLVFSKSTLRLFPEYEVHRKNQEAEADEVVVGKTLRLEEQYGEQREDNQRDSLLNDLQLPEVERATVLLEPDAVGGYLEAVFNECYAPTDKDNQGQCQLPRIETQMTVPSNGHENIGND